VHTYRKHRAGRADSPAVTEERLVYVALCLIGAIPIAVALAHGGAFGVEPTIGLLMALAGAIGLAIARG
jgi:UPF0716 family protein affecting phage T7 exclusion